MSYHADTIIEREQPVRGRHLQGWSLDCHGLNALQVIEPPLNISHAESAHVGNPRMGGFDLLPAHVAGNDGQRHIYTNCTCTVFAPLADAPQHPLILPAERRGLDLSYGAIKLPAAQS